MASISVPPANRAAKRNLCSDEGLTCRDCGPVKAATTSDSGQSFDLGFGVCCGARFERPEFAFLLRLAFANCARGVKHRNISLTIYEVKVLRFSVFFTGASIEISWGFVGAARDNRSCNK